MDGFCSFDPRISKNFFKFRIHRTDPQIEMDLEMRKMEYLKFWDKLKKYRRKNPRLNLTHNVGKW